MDRDTPAKQIMKTLNDVVRYLGASSMAAWEFRKLPDTHGWHRFISMQGYYNLLYREEEREMIPFCRDSGVGIIPWSPLASGVLARAWTDRRSNRERMDAVLADLVRRKASEVDEVVVERVAELAGRYSVAMAIVALAWCLKKCVYPISGLHSVARIDEAVCSVGFRLNDEDSAYVEELYVPKEVIS
ncbi:Versiconal hemiacetal acetate reductase [Lachnellula occidentalis]|uniref:Versiconal hemiacetal acetate reductase n=1 Tax=Lachnellula occidentalis TaxID=215460 RepID=A0A8H8UKH9_9HELO|nr:Versiconal hemiacetal acetate reductase [Lachnellula occidentalis]